MEGRSGEERNTEERNTEERNQTSNGMALDPQHHPETPRRDAATPSRVRDSPPVLAVRFATSKTSTPVLQAPLQPVGEASLKKEGKESKEPQEPKEPKEPKEYGNPPSESQATEAKTVAETKDAGGSSTLHSGGTTNGGDQSGKEAEPEAEMPSMAADECPDLGLEMASSGQLGHATPLTGDAESEDRLAIARDTRTEEAVFWRFFG